MRVCGGAQCKEPTLFQLSRRPTAEIQRTSKCGTSHDNSTLRLERQQSSYSFLPITNIFNGGSLLEA
ncbi:hypothetical protein KIN20_026028 [Parelaphostrongylus tenuis]|uniref:Uncharacterized protein n=1 Tax=Parelaphostrongylus tenuis TaxID=148309 RepID=A0AAD5QXG0_PARTN|nr:hypothetical protein KIN20_026028 [Parelaphostrongylus tenuis]